MDLKEYSKELFYDIRNYFELTQSEMAKRLEVSQSTIAQIETGRKFPSMLLLEKLINVFNLRIEVGL